MGISQDIAEAHAEKFNALREVYLGEAAKLLLLKVDGSAAPYGTLAEVTNGWTAQFSDFFGSTTFKVVNSTSAFAGFVSEAAFVVVRDSDNDALNDQLHAINRETTRPAGVDPFWRIRATPTGKRYVAP